MADIEVPKPRKKKKVVKQDEEIPLADMDSSTSKFDMLLKQAVSQATEGAKAKKKKKKDAHDSVLESLKKGGGLQKEEDEAIKNNTYDPDNSPKNEKSNKRRQKLKELEGKENASFEMTEETQKKKKKKKPKEDSVLETEHQSETPLITDLVPPEQLKKKKKKKPPDETAQDAPSPPPTEEEITTPTKGKKKKKKVEIDETEEKIQHEEPISPRANNKKKKKRVEKEEETIQPPADEPESPKDNTKKKKKVKIEKDEVSSPVLSEEEPGTSTGASAEVKKKKKKKKEKIEGEETEAQDDDVMSKDEEEVEPETPKKKTKKKKTPDPEILTQEEEEKRKQREAIEDEGQILSVMIHRTDKLKNDFHIQHPLVRVHIVDEETGKYLPKQNRDRAVSAYFETQNENVSYIMPIMTQPFDFKAKKSVLPVWEELILFNENYNYFIQEDPKVIVFFELLDYLSMHTASEKFDSRGKEGGWHRIGWAFLKVVGANKKLNVGSKVRLQVFEVPYGFKPKPDQTEIYQWWKLPRRPYPSTLYVTLKGITPPQEVTPALRSMYATQKEMGTKTYQDLKKSMNWTEKRKNKDEMPNFLSLDDQKRTLSSWKRLPGQMCRIPNRQAMTLQAGRMGCFVVQFSHDGRRLACACSDKDGNFPILVYEIPSGELVAKFKGHFNLVYDLCWSKRDMHLMSASSDGTVRVWDADTFDFNYKLLPHPGYVYCCKFHPRVDNIVVTGGYDQVVRVWDIDEENQDAMLKQELEDHAGHVNSMCFDDDGLKLYTADSVGCVFIWNVYVNEAPVQQDYDPSDEEDKSYVAKIGVRRDWSLYHKIEDAEIKDVCINHIQLHHSGRRLLVHCRDNVIRMIDLRMLVGEDVVPDQAILFRRIMQKYIGALNFREQIRSTITPCGTFVFSGSEDNYAYAWNTDTGDQVAMFTELNYQHSVTDIDYHPRDHMFAVCSLGDNQPVLVYDYDSQIAQMDAGLTPRYIMTESGDEATAPGSPKLDTSMVLTKDEFQAHTTARLDKVMKKLNSATSQMMSMPSMDLPGVPSTSTLGHTGFLNMDTDMTPRAMRTSPQMFSPHASRTMTGIMHQQQFASQKLYMKSTESEWRPAFSDMGRSGGRSSSPTFVGRPPTIALSAGGGQKAQFSFQAPIGKATSYPQVVALYDYRAQRSDELNIFKGDVISVLHKDSENWWMGELPNGEQGFFPVSYVAAEGDDLGQTLNETPTHSHKKKKYTAVRKSSGELSIVSGTEDSEEELLSAKPKKPKGKKKRGSQGSIVSDAGSTSGKRNLESKLPNDVDESHA